MVFHNFGKFVSLFGNFGGYRCGRPHLKAGQLQVLVATDVAARGLHVKHLLGNPGNIGRDRKTLRMVKDLDMCIKDPERTGSFSRVYCLLKGHLLFSCIFLVVGASEEWN